MVVPAPIRVDPAVLERRWVVPMGGGEEELGFMDPGLGCKDPKEDEGGTLPVPPPT